MPQTDAALKGRIGAYVKWSRTSDRTAATAPARAGFLARFEREVDPDGKLDPLTRAQRAESARRAYFARLAYARHRSGGRKASTA